ncbi:GGDEF-domain containing protein, partial [Streptomyces sp. NPDC057074]
MEPTESAAAGSRLRLRRMTDAWHAGRWAGLRAGGAPYPAASARGSVPPGPGQAPDLSGAEIERQPSWPAFPAAVVATAA